MTQRFRRALTEHSRILNLLDASRYEIRQSLHAWVKQDSLADVSKELGFSLPHISNVCTGRRAWGNFHWRDRI